MNGINARRAIGAVFVTLAACGGRALDVGSNETTYGTGGSAGSMAVGGNDGNACPGRQVPWGASGGSGPVVTRPLPEWPDGSSYCEGEPGPLRGTWKGSGLSPNGVHDGLPDFSVSLETGRALPCGTLTFGDPMTFAPATDPAEPYAPGGGYPGNLAMLPGFSYTTLDGTFEKNRMRFRIDFAEPWRSFCQLQTPRCNEEYGGYYCSEEGTGHCARDPRNPQGEPCACDTMTCDANLKAYELLFDLHVVGDTADGNAAQYPVYLDKE